MKIHYLSIIKSTATIFILFFILAGCKPEEVKANRAPSVTTTIVSNITRSAATSGGTIIAEGDATLIQKGVCWSKEQNPTISDSITKNGNGIGIFISYLRNLAPATTYYVRAYATNEYGTSYGNEITFTTNTEASADGFAKGADISWLPQMEASGFKFYNADGQEKDCIEILKENGINSIRLRTWVNPSNDKWSGHCSKDETVAIALRAKNAGMRIMIDFHYSDSWADPSKQVKPAAWANLGFSQLKEAVYNYTVEVMTALKNAGITPEWVQVGNEITPGMLLPDGGSDDAHFPQLVELINKGYDGVKAISSTSKVILHIDQGNNNSRFRWWFDNATKYGAKYDVIGLSYYPYWLSNAHPDYTLSINDLYANMNDMVTRYGKEVMVVEVGGEDTKAQNTYDLLKAVIKYTSQVQHSKGLGVFYWEPEGQSSWSNYALSAWMYGKPTKALEAFK